jgi:hypothetical protein
VKRKENHVFSSKTDGEVASWVGPLCAAALHGNRLRWLHWGNENSSWNGEIALPKGVGAGSVLAVHPAPEGLSVLTTAGELLFYDLARSQWIRCGDVVKAGERT